MTSAWLLDFGAGAGLVIALALALWLLSLARRDASIVDIAWGPGFVALAVLYAGRLGFSEVTQAARPRVVGLAIVLWGLRLGIYIARRNLGHGEDRRYAAMRRAAGRSFAWRSLFSVFLLQGGLMLLLSAPHRAALDPSRRGWNWIDGLAFVLFAAGLLCEAIADGQLRRFQRDAANRGRVMDRGLWAWSRHPNYFGEALVWWGFGAFAVAAGAPWALFAPALMTFLLLRVSGVTLLERTMVETRPGYADYVRRTSAFLPRPPRSVR